MAKRSRERINRIVALIAGAVLAFGLVPAPALAAGGLGESAEGGGRPRHLASWPPSPMTTRSS